MNKGKRRKYTFCLNFGVMSHFTACRKRRQYLGKRGKDKKFASRSNRATIVSYSNNM
jgi:hypothetical protein